MADTLDPANLDAIFKAYDVRGTVPDQIDDDLARAHRRARSSQVTGAATVVVGHDMRPSSPGLAGAFADGATAAGADVVLIGLASTDQLYFASGHLGHPGAMFTASHNPAQYNGIKMCRADALPIGMETGLAEIRDLVARARRATAAAGRAAITEQDVLEAYAAHLLALAPVDGPPAEGRRRRRQRHGRATPRRRSSGGSAGPGRAGADVLRARRHLPQPRGQPDRAGQPRRPAARVRRGAAPTSGWPSTATPTAASWSTSRAGRSRPSTLTALIAARELAKEPGATVIHNLITSRAVPEIVTELGGTPVRTRVGHSFIKATMAETGAIFGGEHSGHFYFRDFWRADSGMLAALHALAALAETDQPLSELLADYERYVASGEINSTVADQAGRARPRSRRRTPTATASPSTTSTGSPSATPTGGSTSARPTPSRCCASTPRAATRPPWRASATTSSPMIRRTR